MTNTIQVDWSLYDGRARQLEEKFSERLVGSRYANDSIRLSRFLLGLANLLRPKLNGELLMYLDLVEQWHRSGKYPIELVGVSTHLGAKAAELLEYDNTQGVRSGNQFIYSLMEACTTEKLAVTADNEVNAIGWMIALGFSVDELDDLVESSYP